MRLFLVLLLCLALATCTRQLPQVQLVQPAAEDLGELRDYRLIPPDLAVQGELPFGDDYIQLATLLRQGLATRGYRESPTPQMHVYYWLAMNDAPLEFRVDVPPPDTLGPYLAIHRLHDETGTLRVRLTDPDGRSLWEGLVSTGLSPSRTSPERLETIVEALLQRLPAAR
jgi:hypothetical protein